jgi:TonB family protein
MDRESKRLAKTRAAALLVTVLVHGLILIWALTLNAPETNSIPVLAIQVVPVDMTARSRNEEKLSELRMNEIKPVVSQTAITYINIPAEPPPPQALRSEETSDSNASVVASNGASISSTGNEASNGEGEGMIVAHRVQPIYSDASVKAREQGYVVVGLLVDEHGAVRKTQVVQSSGYRRLDQSAVDALRQWTFTRVAGAAPGRTWTTFRYGFHLASSNVPDLSSISLALLPYDPALAEQIRAAALPTIAAEAPRPHGAAALRRLIAAIQSAAPVDRDPQGPMPPVQLLIKLGAVKSIRFLGLESHGLDVNSIDKAAGANSGYSPESQWELYEVTQQGGKSEWLIDVTRSGVIGTAQAMTCTPGQDGLIRCPQSEGARR